MTVRLERPSAHVAVVVMDRPDALNALSSAQARALTEAFATLAADPAVGAVVLASSNRRAFCVGADLKERLSMDAAALREQRPVLVAAFTAVRTTVVPVVVAVDGFALGGGCELALGGDLVVAGDEATFALPEVRLGLVPGGGGTQLLSRRIGLGAARDLVLTGRHVGADEAHRLGLADRLVPAGTARAAAEEIATVIAGHAPVAVRAAKRALNEGFDLGLDAALALEGAAWDEAMSAPDRVEGVAAFVEHRAPRWPSWSGNEATP